MPPGSAQLLHSSFSSSPLRSVFPSVGGFTKNRLPILLIKADALAGSTMGWATPTRVILAHPGGINAAFSYQVCFHFVQEWTEWCDFYNSDGEEPCPESYSDCIETSRRTLIDDTTTEYDVECLIWT